MNSNPTDEFTLTRIDPERGNVAIPQFSFLTGPPSRRGPTHVQLPKNALERLLDRITTDVKLRRNFLVGEASRAEVSDQPHYLEQPNPWAAFVQRYTQKAVATKAAEDSLLQRKIRTLGNFVEYVPLALLFIVTFGPSPGRAIGFFLTWFVYLVGASACIYAGIAALI